MLKVLAHSMEEKQASLSGSVVRSYAHLKLLKKQDTIIREALQRLDGAAQHFPRAALPDPPANLREWFATRGARAAEACVKELLRGPAEEEAALEPLEGAAAARATASLRGSAPEWFPGAVLVEESALVEELLAGVAGGVRQRMPEVVACNQTKCNALLERMEEAWRKLGGRVAAEAERGATFEALAGCVAGAVDDFARLAGQLASAAIAAGCVEQLRGRGRQA